MASRKSKSSSHSDIDVEEFSRQIFGTDNDYDHIFPLKKEPTRLEKSHSSAPGIALDQRGKTVDGKDTNTLSDILVAHRSNIKQKKQEKPSVAGPKKDLKVQSSSQSIRSIPGDSREATLTKFLELRDEFITLSGRLDRVNMPEASKRLTKVLAERQRLMAMLLEMGMSPPRGYLRHNHDDGATRQLQQADQNGKERGYGMLKKTKSVHWSDEFLGGSIIQEPNSRYGAIDSPPTLQPYNNPGRGGETLHRPKSYKRQTKEEVFNPTTHREKSPPPYQIDQFTQTNRRRSHRTKSSCDIQGRFCSSGIGHAVGCVEEIANEAATLRREACYMLWRAHYLEQLCDVDAVFNHIYHSDVPALPHHSSFRQNDHL